MGEDDGWVKSPARSHGKAEGRKDKTISDGHRHSYDPHTTPSRIRGALSLYTESVEQPSGRRHEKKLKLDALNSLALRAKLDSPNSTTR